jgi:Trk K+ transport system NAD-binding subunit
MKNELLALLIFIVLVLLQAFIGHLIRKRVTISLSDEKLLELFPPNQRLSLDGFAIEITKVTKIVHPLSEVAERLDRLITSGKVTAHWETVQSVHSSVPSSHNSAPKQRMYCLV